MSRGQSLIFNPVYSSLLSRPGHCELATMPKRPASCEIVADPVRSRIKAELEACRHLGLHAIPGGGLIIVAVTCSILLTRRVDYLAG